VLERTFWCTLGWVCLYFLQKYTVNWLDNIARVQKYSQLRKWANLWRNTFYECLNMGRGLSARTHFDDWARFACTFLQNYTVKWLDNTYSNSQSPSEEQKSIERMGKNMKEHFFIKVFEHWTWFKCYNTLWWLGWVCLYFSPKLYRKMTW